VKIKSRRLMMEMMKLMESWLVAGDGVGVGNLNGVNGID
jgi:hypothetical protein